MGLSVIIPMYNERERIMPTLRELEIYDAKHPGHIDEVVLVDDGSRDQTVERALYFDDRLNLNIVMHPENKGKWAAIQTGLRAANRDGCLILDADGSASIFELERISADTMALALVNYYPIFGSRYTEGARVDGKTAFRKLVSQGYRTYSRMLYWWASRGKTDVHDMQAPFKLVYKSRIDLDSMKVNQFAGDIELALSIEEDIITHPLQFVHKAGSRVKPGSVLQMAWETMKVAWRKRYEKK